MDTNKTFQYKKLLQTDFPHLVVDSIKIIGRGWDHDAVEVNDEIIFRLPRDVHEVGKTSATVKYEVPILKHMQNKLSVSVPEPLYVNSEGSYFGYKKLSGTLLRGKKLSVSEQEFLKSDWIRIAAEVHAAISIEEATKVGVPSFNGFDTSTAETVFQLPKIEKAVLVFAEKIISSVHSLKRSNITNKFLHNDLQPQNLLLDPSTKRICGVIDWTDVCIGPIAREFAVEQWMSDINELKQVISFYETATGEEVDLSQVILWRAVEEISDYVEQVALNETKEAFATVSRIQQLIKLMS